MEIRDPDEKVEARAVGIWLARGVGFSLLGGVLWAWPNGYDWLRLLAVAAAVILTILAFSVASLSATITRNIIGRYFQLHSRPWIVVGTGLAIFVCYTALMMMFFLLGAWLFSLNP